MGNLEVYGVQSLNDTKIIRTNGGTTLPLGYAEMTTGLSITGNILHAAGDFLAGAWSRLNEYRN